MADTVAAVMTVSTVVLVLNKINSTASVFHQLGILALVIISNAEGNIKIKLKSAAHLAHALSRMITTVSVFPSLALFRVDSLQSQ